MYLGCPPCNRGARRHLPYNLAKGRSSTGNEDSRTSTSCVSLGALESQVAAVIAILSRIGRVGACVRENDKRQI